MILTVVYCLTPWTLVNRYINQFLFSKIGKILSFPTPEYIPHGLNLVHTYYYTSPSFLVECSILAIFSHCHNILHWLYLKTNSPQNFSFVWHILVLHIWTEAKLYIVLDSHKNIYNNNNLCGTPLYRLPLGRCNKNLKQPFSHLLLLFSEEVFFIVDFSMSKTRSFWNMDFLVV